MNSTGSVTSWNTTISEKARIPICTSGCAEKSRPAMISGMDSREPRLVTGIMGIAEGERGIIRCMLDAWPTSWAATPMAAMEVEVYTESESRTTLERGS